MPVSTIALIALIFVLFVLAWQLIGRPTSQMVRIVLAVFAIIFAAVLLFAGFGAMPAWGQEAETVTVVAAEEPGLIDQITDDLVDVVIIVVGGALTWAAAVAVTFVRGKIGELAADKLKGALDRAVAVGQAAAGNTVRAGADYLKQQLPDTIKTLKMSDAQVTGLVEAKLAADAKAATAPPHAKEGVAS